MNRSTAVPLLASLLLCAAHTTAQEELRTVFVVRHDPSLIQLHVTMLEALLGPDAQRAAIADLESVPASVRESLPFRVALDPVDDGGTRQPPGVFVGQLTLFYPDDTAAEVAPAVTEALLSSLRVALDDRLHARPRRALIEELTRIDESAEKLAGELVAEQDVAMRREQEGALREKLERAQLEFESQRSVAESLRAELERARDSTTETLAERHRQEIDIQRTRAELETLRARLEQLRRSMSEQPANEAQRREAEEAAMRLQALAALLAEKEARRDLHAHEQMAAEERVARMAAALEQAKVDATRHETARRMIEKKLVDTRTEERDASRELPVRKLEQKLATLEQQRARVAERLASLRPVELEIWR